MSATAWASLYLLAGLLLGAWAWHELSSPAETESMTDEVPEMRQLPTRVATVVWHGVLVFVAALVVVAWPLFAGHMMWVKVDDWSRS